MIAGTMSPDSRGVEVSLPADLASEGKDCFLLLQADERSQCFVHDGLLRWQGREFLRLTYQVLIQDNVGSQWITSVCMVSPNDVYDQCLHEEGLVCPTGGKVAR